MPPYRAPINPTRAPFRPAPPTFPSNIPKEPTPETRPEIPSSETIPERAFVAATTSKPSTPTEYHKPSTYPDPPSLSTAIIPQPPQSSLPLAELSQPSIAKPSNARPAARSYTGSRSTNINPITFTVNSIASSVVQQIYWLRYFFG